MKKSIVVVIFIAVISLSFFGESALIINIHTLSDLDTWIAEHPSIRDTIILPSQNYGIPYISWTSAQKDELFKKYNKIQRHKPLDLYDPLPNIYSPADNEYPTTIIEETQAINLYLAYVAHSLVVEIEKWVPWSIGSYNKEDLQILFDGTRMFWYDQQRGGFTTSDDIQRILPAPPDYVFEFLSNESLIGDSQLNTISDVLLWCGQHMYHYAGPFLTKNVENHWHYRGVPPLSRVIEGTPCSDYPQFGINHYTAGCMGTSNFLNVVLRTANIPVTHVIRGNNVLPYFTSEHKYLDHGDAPYFSYNGRFELEPRFTMLDLLIDQKKFNEWFGDQVSEEEQARNVERRGDELLIEYLPNQLLAEYAGDVAQGKSHSEGEIYNNIFKWRYTLQALEAMGLWTRMDEKIAKLGGYNKIPTNFYGRVWVSTDYGNIKTKVGLNRVMMKGFPHNIITHANGSYKVEVPNGWSGIVIPTRSGNVFSPPQTSYSKVKWYFQRDDYMDKSSPYKVILKASFGGTTEPPPGIYYHGPGAEVYVRAKPDRHYRFVNWSGNVSGLNSPIKIVMDSNKSILANFAFKLVNPPSNLTAVRLKNRSVTQTEQIVDLNWEANPANDDLTIASYRVYQNIGGSWIKLADLPAVERSYRHRMVSKEEQTYGVTSVSDDGVESSRITVTK